MKRRGMVHIVDDEPAVRRSLARLLQSAGFGTADYRSGSAFLTAAKAGLSAGCLLLDVRMPGMDGLEVQSRLNELKFSLPVIVMTGHGDVQTAVRAMKAGAADFIEKPVVADVLFMAIEEAQSGGRRMARQREAARAAERIGTLSPRERQVLEALTAGNSNKMIAYDLNLSVRTVEVHRARMLERLGTHSLAEAVRLMVMATLA
jgi:two-component system, LuxR family, response regulator FixJ